jgi:hypothetical protein
VSTCCTNTSYARIFGLKLFLRTDGEKWSRKNTFEIPPCAKPFSENLFYFIERWIFAKTANSVIQMTFFAHIINETLSKQISTILHFEYVNEV